MLPYLGPELIAAIFGLQYTSDAEKPQSACHHKLAARSLCLESDFKPSPEKSIKAQLAPNVETTGPTNPSLHRLRLDILEMLRISLRAVDYSMQAYALGLPEFAHHVGCEQEKVNLLNRTIISASQKLYDSEHDISVKWTLGRSALMISLGLSSTYQHAIHISTSTLALLRTRKYPFSRSFEQLGRNVREYLRLCILAVVERNVGYAETVLNRIKRGRSAIFAKDRGAAYTAPSPLANTIHVRTIATSLEQMIENLGTIASASIVLIQLLH